MNNLSFKQFLGGISVMFSVLFLLAIAGNMQGIKSASTSLVKDLDTQLVKPLDPSAEMNNPAAPDNVISGTFNTETKGNVVYAAPDDSSTNFHYKAIRHTKLSAQDAKPRLKLEVRSDNGVKWKDTAWSWIDYDQGILYFHYITEQNGELKMVESFTGNYQLIF